MEDVFGSDPNERATRVAGTAVVEAFQGGGGTRAGGEAIPGGMADVMRASDASGGNCGGRSVPGGRRDAEREEMRYLAGWPDAM
jgi:hypothetical protein